MFLVLLTADFIVLPETCYVFDLQIQDFISGRGDLGQLNFPEVRAAHSKALNLRLCCCNLETSASSTPFFSTSPLTSSLSQETWEVTFWLNYSPATLPLRFWGKNWLSRDLPPHSLLLVCALLPTTPN